MIQEVDQWVGKLVQRLKDSGIDENTLVIFTSDHGEVRYALYVESAIHPNDFIWPFHV